MTLCDVFQHNYGMYYGRMSSVFGSNVAIACKYLNMSVDDAFNKRCGG